MTLDDFWKANYWRMVGYCRTLWAIEADVEEAVADVIYKHFDEFAGKIEIEGNGKYDVMRRWMNRRALLNLNARTGEYRRGDREVAGHEDASLQEPLHWDTPENILDIAQRLPRVAPILIEYEPYGGAVSARGENTSADKTRFCRERKKFMEALAA